jgi:hypothetical protein
VRHLIRAASPSASLAPIRWTGAAAMSTTQQMWRAPNGQLHLAKSCPYGAPASQHRMTAERLSDEQLAAAADVCRRCAWRAKRDARINLGLPPEPDSKRQKRRAGYPVGIDHNPHEITSGFETNRRRH